MLRFCLLLGFMSCFNMMTAQDITGDWGGAIDIQGMQLRLVFHISEADNKYVATMDSPDQGAKGIVVDNVIYNFPNITMTIDRMNFTYKGRVNTSFSKIKGAVSQAGAQVEVDLKRVSENENIVFRPQTPRPPFPYFTEEVSYLNTISREQLGGTLTLPASGDQHKAVILISGSGAQSRNSTIMEHQPFWVIADYLTRQGIAVLRVDDRGVGASSGEFAKATTADFATDVRAGINYLKTRKEIDPTQIGLIGHSEGGIIAPMIAAEEDSDVAFIVMLAGAGVPVKELMKLQRTKVAQSNGATESSAINEKMLKKAHKIIKKDRSEAFKREKLTRYVARQFDKFSEKEQEQLGGKAVFVPMFTNQILNPWYQYFITINPKTYLTKIDIPVLALNGLNDTQVTAVENIRAIEKWLEKGGNTQYTTRIIPELNHLFQHSETGSPSEYGKIEETFDKETLELMGTWILER